MLIGPRGTLLICDSCLLRSSVVAPRVLPSHKNAKRSIKLSPLSKHDVQGPTSQDGVVTEVDEQGRMSQRLSQMTEEAIEQGDRNIEKVIEGGDFSEELKRKLEQRIQDTSFRNENPAAFAELDMPVSIYHPSDFLYSSSYISRSLAQVKGLVLRLQHSRGQARKS